MSNNRKIELSTHISAAYAGKRLDQALAQCFPDYSRVTIQHWIKTDCIKINGEIVNKTRYKVQENDQVVINSYLTKQIDYQPQAIDLNIVYEDDSILVIDKPAGLVVHPGAGNPDQTLVNALLHHNPKLSQLPRAGIVHRLDKDTTGLLVIACSLTAYNALIAAMKQRDIKREYEAIVKGTMVSGGMIDAPVGRHRHYRTRMAVNPTGKPAITHYRITERFSGYTHLAVELETGRTHQIRVHLAHIRHPIVGDPIYGRQFVPKVPSTAALKHALSNLKRQALHAVRLSCPHPISGKLLTWESPIPTDMQTLIDALRADNDSSS